MKAKEEKAKRTGRVTVSVPKEIIAEMRRHKADVNWSAVATNAFARKLAGFK